MTRLSLRLGLVTLGLCLVFSAHLLAAVAYIDSIAGGSGANGDSFTTAALNAVGATLLTGYVADYDTGSVTGVTDTESNTWTALGSLQTSGGGFPNQGRPYYVNGAPTVDASVQITVSGTDIFGAACIFAFSGTVTTGVTDQLTERGDDGGENPIRAGSLTPSEHNTVVLAGMGWADGSGTITSMDSGFTLAENAAVVPGERIGIACGYLIQTTAAAANPGFNMSGTSSFTVANWNMKSTSGAITTIPVPQLIGVAYGARWPWDRLYRLTERAALLSWHVPAVELRRMR